ncbi:hypothetical protein ACGTJS_09915 [Faucicola mancuniensis]|uniref:hypothetical protein n=1 Tax=Faucicola mancuniensis TaxID=1309795 RepID=UPI003977B156
MAIMPFFRTCIHNVSAMKNEINRQLFKEKTQTDSHSTRQVFDIEPQDLAIFHAKANKYLLKNL